MASSEFHSRFDATGRLYQYLIWNAPVRSALWDRFAWHLAAPLDIEAMQRAAVILSGRHDFRAFGKPARQGLSTVRLVRRIRVRQRLGLVVVSVEGNAFLRHMVRAMVGTLVAVGRGKLSHDAVSEMIRSCDPASCPPVAPPRGLCLLRVNYAGRRVVEG